MRELKRLRIYADTSVLGGVFDDKFAIESRKLIEEIIEGKFILVLSTTTLTELKYAPGEVRQLIAELPGDCFEIIELSEDIELLRDAYIKAGVLGEASFIDAEHIANATVAGVDLVVSWNFRHIVNYEKIRGFNGVNLLEGYNPIVIHSPKEIVSL